MAKKKTTGKAQSPRKPVRKVKPSTTAARPTGASAAKRTDLGAGIDGYFTALNGEHRRIAEALRAIIEKASPQARAGIKWGMPVYEHHGMLCYIRARPKYVTLGFYESGASLDDPEKLLEGTGDNMRHIKVRSMAEVNSTYFMRMVKEAVAFNERGK